MDFIISNVKKNILTVIRFIYRYLKRYIDFDRRVNMIKNIWLIIFYFINQLGYKNNSIASDKLIQYNKRKQNTIQSSEFQLQKLSCGLLLPYAITWQMSVTIFYYCENLLWSQSGANISQGQAKLVNTIFPYFSRRYIAQLVAPSRVVLLIYGIK